MPAKQVEVDGIGPINLYKRSNARSIRISITHRGQVRVSIPSWAPYSAGIKFAEDRKDWIVSELPITKELPQGYSVGKAHHISYESSTGSSVTSRITGNQVRVLLPSGTRWDDPNSHQVAATGAIRALKKEAKMLLPHRIQVLAKAHGFTYGTLAYKQMTGRWGSCSDKKDLTFNCFLLQLPWDLIDYVILHELTHTKVMAHGPVFWNEMEQVLPNVKALRKRIKAHKPIL